MMASDKLAAIEEVDIDASGTFKYVLINCYLDDKTKQIIRGHAWAQWHADVYEQTCDRIAGLGVETECVGGGRMKHEPGKKSIKVYGYSQGYGRADHSVAVELLKKKYTDYTDITWSNDGY